MPSPAIKYLQVNEALKFYVGSKLHFPLSFFSFLPSLEIFGGITEAWKQVVVQILLLVCGIITAC